MFYSVCDQKCEWMNKGIYITLDEKPSEQSVVVF